MGGGITVSSIDPFNLPEVFSNEYGPPVCPTLLDLREVEDLSKNATP